MGNRASLIQEQKQILSQQQIESLEILSMDMQELSEFLSKEQDENPALNYVRSAPPPKHVVWGDLDARDETEDIPALSEETTQDMLLSQINPRSYTPDEMEAFGLIAGTVDERGFLTVTMEELSEISRIPLTLLDECLETMRNLDPPGVCSLTLEDCLLRQLSRMGNDDEVLLAIVKRHLRDIANGKINLIAQVLGTTTARVRQCVQMIRTLNPNPLNGLFGEAAQYAIPDVILHFENGLWEIEINHDWIGRLEICDYYAELARKTMDADLKNYLSNKLERIRFLNNSIEKRRDTLLRIGQRVASSQSDFFLRRGAMAALTMTRLADDLELHISTVSRAINGKYMQTPRGVFKIRALFQQGLATCNIWKGNTQTSQEDVKERIQKFILAEDKKKPYSDNNLFVLLKKQGIDISRRTVTKYRLELGVMSTYDRRCS
jgi:RNA polymerase sigma-54 factor